MAFHCAGMFQMLLESNKRRGKGINWSKGRPSRHPVPVLIGFLAVGSSWEMLNISRCLAIGHLRCFRLHFGASSTFTLAHNPKIMLPTRRKVCRCGLMQGVVDQEWLHKATKNIAKYRRNTCGCRQIGRA